MLETWGDERMSGMSIIPQNVVWGGGEEAHYECVIVTRLSGIMSLRIDEVDKRGSR